MFLNHYQQSILPHPTQPPIIKAFSKKILFPIYRLHINNGLKVQTLPPSLINLNSFII